MSRELSAHVIALDQSARMVELTAARGVEAMVGAYISAEARSVAVFAAVLVVLLVRPRGLLGETAAA